MPSVRINKELNDEIYFLTLTVKRWYYLFDRHNRWDILLESLKYCQQHKGLLIYNWVFMLNHIHLIAKAGDMMGFVRDFKTFTSKPQRSSKFRRVWPFNFHRPFWPEKVKKRPSQILQDRLFQADPYPDIPVIGSPLLSF